MFRATLKSLLSRKLRLTLSALAVMLGVMFVSGAFVLTDSLGKSFDKLFAGINTQIDVQVTAKPKVGSDTSDPTDPIEKSAVDRIGAVPGVRKVTGQVFVDGARVIGKDGKVKSSFAPRFGSNWTGEDGLVELREGRGPTAPDEIAIDASLASQTGYRVGDSVGVLTLQPKKTFRLVGIFGYSGDRDTLGGSQVVAFTLPVAQQLMLGEKDVFNAVDVTGTDRGSDAALRDSIRQTVGSGFDVRTADEVTEANSADIKDGLKFFNYILLGFAGVALFVGIFLILNTFSMLVAQRTRELALLRAVGASRGQVINSVMLEAVVIGLIASVVGLAAGIGVGALLAFVFGRTGGSNVDLALSVPLIAVVAAFVVGLGVTLVAALVPALRASRIPPIAAMRDAATPDKPLTVVTTVGTVIFGLGAVALALGLTDNAGGGNNALWAILAGVLLAFIGVALLTPLISRPVVSVLGRLFSWSVPGMLGRRNSARNPRRTAVTAAALMVSIALITGISTILASATKSISNVLSQQVQADLIVSGQQTGPLPPTFDEAVVRQTEDIPGVASVAAVYLEPGRIAGERTFLAAVNDLGAVKNVLGLKADSGNVDRLGPKDLVVDAEAAKEQGLRVGSTVPVQGSRGDPTTYTVSGIYAENDALSGYLLPKEAVASFRVAQPAQAFIQLDDGTDVGAVEDKVETLLADSPEVTVQDRSAFVDQTTGQFDTVLVFIQILLALAILIAVLGIVNTLALSVIERTRELGLLRAIGLRRSQTMRMITVESVVISVFGALLGIVVGVGLGLAVVQALRDDGFTSTALPWGQMATYLVLSAVVGVIAAVLPAVRAARLNVLNAISYE